MGEWRGVCRVGREVHPGSRVRGRSSPQLAAAARSALAALLILSTPCVASAQGVHVMPYAGYVMYRGPATATPVFSGSANGTAFGVQLGLGLLPAVSLVANVGRASDLRGDAAIGGRGQAQASFYDADVEVGLPLRLWGVQPFAQAGGGWIREETSVAGEATRATRFAWNIGGGLDMRLLPGVGLRLMARGYRKRDLAVLLGVRVGF
jgi:opacity protein-like surface antigen